MLFDIREQTWDAELCQYLGVPVDMLPDVADSAGEFGVADPEWFGAEIPITGIAGDQQSALIGQACFEVGMSKSTYGTGCFLMTNTGPMLVNSSHGLLTTVGYRIDGVTTYALEGSIFVAGVAVKWLRDKLRVVVMMMRVHAHIGAGIVRVFRRKVLMMVVLVGMIMTI